MIVEKCHYVIYRIGTKVLRTGLMLSKQFEVLLLLYIRPIKCKVVETNLEPTIQSQCTFPIAINHIMHNLI